MTSGRSRVGLLGRLAQVRCALALSAFAPRAQAQLPEAPRVANSAAPGPSAADEQRRLDAAAHAARGVALAKSGAFEPALAEFAASLKLFRTRNALINSALCLRDLGRYVESRETLQNMLSEFGASVPADERSAVTRLLATLEAHIGSIQIDSLPLGATVIVDGQQRGVTPLDRAVALDAGAHSIRVTKDGFATIEASVSVEGGRSSALNVVLEARREAGTLQLREAAGKVLDVVVDGAVIGKTPFSGPVAPGSHSVLLQGPGELGTPPSSVSIRPNESTALVLSAVQLDSELRVEPTPSNASVILDGVDVGHGVWQGRLNSGPHRLDLTADEHRPLAHEFVARAGHREVLKLKLERIFQFPKQALSAARVYAEVMAGLAWSPGFHGSADSACGDHVTNLAGDSVRACKSRSAPFGFMAGVRGGYLITPNVGVELALGYIWLKQSVQRRLLASHDVEPDPLYSDDFADTTVAALPFAAVSFAYRFPLKTPLTLRAWLGASRATVFTSNRGTFQSAPDVAGAIAPTNVAIPEQNQHFWLPFAGPELRVGYALSKSLSIDAGLAALLFFPGDTPRSATSGSSNLSHRSGERSLPLPDQTGGTAGVLTLPNERAIDTFVALVPSVAVRFQFH